MASVSVISIDDLVKARETAYSNANAPGQDFDKWMVLGDRLEAARQKLAAVIIDNGSSVYQDNLGSITQATTDLNDANSKLQADADALAAFAKLVGSVESLATTIAPLVA